MIPEVQSIAQMLRICNIWAISLKQAEQTMKLGWGDWSFEGTREESGPGGAFSL